MTDTRRFHFGTLVTVVHDKFVAPNGWDDVYAVLAWMVGEPVATHQVPLAVDAVRPDLLAQHPWLNDVTVPGHVRGPESLKAWFAIATARWGEWHDVAPNPACWGSHDPVEDMVALGRDPSTVIPVEMPGSDT